MEKLANSMNIRVFCQPVEDETEIREGLRILVPLDLEKEKLQLHESTALGFNEKKIKIFELRLEKYRHIVQAWGNIAWKLGREQLDLLLNQLDSRLDEDMNFFFRIDKTRLLKSRKVVLTDEGNCYHFRINISAFPRRRENAIEAAKKLVLEKI